MRSPLFALLVIAALAPSDRAVSAQEAGAAAGPTTSAEAPKAKAIEPIVPPVRRVMPVTPPPSKEIKGVNAGPKSQTAGPGTACKPRKGLKASCAPAAAASAARAKPAARSAAKPVKASLKTAPKTAPRAATKAAPKSAGKPAARKADRTAASGK